MTSHYHLLRTIFRVGAVTLQALSAIYLLTWHSLNPTWSINGSCSTNFVICSDHHFSNLNGIAPPPLMQTHEHITHNDYFLSHQGLKRESASLSSQGKFDTYQVIWYQILICLLCFVFCFILLGQFLKYVEQDEDINPPIKLEPCLSALKDQVYLTEPLVSSLRKALFCSWLLPLTYFNF